MTGKKKKAKTELISCAALAKRCGVTRGAVTSWIKNLEKRGIIIAVKAGRRNKYVDLNNPTVKRYVENAGGDSRRESGAESPDRRSDNLLRKITYTTRKIEIQNTLLQEKYISRNAALTLLDELEKLEHRLFSEWAGRVLDEIAAEGKIPMPLEKRIRCAVMIDETLQRARGTNGRIIDKFRKDTAPKTAAKKRA